MSQAGQAAGYKQDEILAALEDLRSSSKDEASSTAPAPTAHVLIPDAQDDGAPGLDQAKLAAAHRETYARTGDPRELEAAIMSATQAIQLAPANIPWRPSILGLMGELSLEKFQRSGNLVDLDQAVAILQQALSETAMDSPVYAQVLSQLARAVQARFESLGDVADQEQVLALLQRLEEVRRGPR